jgi:hypothetical protein
MILDYSSVTSDAIIKLDQITSDASILVYLPMATPVPPAATNTVNVTAFTTQDSVAVTNSTVTKSNAVVDIKLRHICDHNLSDSHYTQYSCPRCLGRGYYFDIKFDGQGKTIVLSKEDKLAQSLEKILITEINLFHPEYAANLPKWLGKLAFNEIKELIKYDIVNAVGRIKAYQDSFPGTFSSRASIATLDSIDVYEVEVGSLQYNVSITTVSGQQMNIKGELVLNDLYNNTDTGETYA